MLFVLLSLLSSVCLLLCSYLLFSLPVLSRLVFSFYVRLLTYSLFSSHALLPAYFILVVFYLFASLILMLSYYHIFEYTHICITVYTFLGWWWILA